MKTFSSSQTLSQRLGLWPSMPAMNPVVLIVSFLYFIPNQEEPFVATVAATRVNKKPNLMFHLCWCVSASISFCCCRLWTHCANLTANHFHKSTLVSFPAFVITFSFQIYYGLPNLLKDFWDTICSQIIGKKTISHAKFNINFMFSKSVDWFFGLLFFF